jgi:hypothetical protein
MQRTSVKLVTKKTKKSRKRRIFIRIILISSKRCPWATQFKHNLAASAPHRCLILQVHLIPRQVTVIMTTERHLCTCSQHTGQFLLALRHTISLKETAPIKEINGVVLIETISNPPKHLLKQDIIIQATSRAEFKVNIGIYQAQLMGTLTRIEANLKPQMLII